MLNTVRKSMDSQDCYHAFSDCLCRVAPSSKNLKLKGNLKGHSRLEIAYLMSRTAYIVLEVENCREKRGLSNVNIY